MRRTTQKAFKDMQCTKFYLYFNSSSRKKKTRVHFIRCFFVWLPTKLLMIFSKFVIGTKGVFLAKNHTKNT